MDGWTKVRYLASALLIATSVVAFACHRSQSPPVTTPPPPATEVRVKPPTPTVPTTVKVHVAGAVVTPGVYEVSRDARVEDAVRAAGGLTDTADLSRVNLAEHVRDGKKIDVPTLTPRPEGDSGSPSPTGDGGPWDLNEVTVAQLDTLPGIGQITAKKIVDHRTQNGSFKSVEELKALKLVNAPTYERIKDRLFVR